MCNSAVSSESLPSVAVPTISIGVKHAQGALLSLNESDFLSVGMWLIGQDSSTTAVEVPADFGLPVASVSGDVLSLCNIYMRPSVFKRTHGEIVPIFLNLELIVVFTMAL